MNKTEKLICIVLGAVLAWYIFNETGKAKEAAKANAAAATNVVEKAGAQKGEAASSPLVEEMVCSLF